MRHLPCWWAGLPRAELDEAPFLPRALRLHGRLSGRELEDHLLPYLDLPKAQPRCMPRLAPAGPGPALRTPALHGRGGSALALGAPSACAPPRLAEPCSRPRPALASPGGSSSSAPGAASQAYMARRRCVELEFA
eukprot:2696144-Pyramimonas_sp.AAC.1